MASRMERYYRSNNPKRRSQINQDLYHNIYEDGEYSNIEGVAMIDKSNEIDITKVKKMLKNREEYKKQKEYRNLIKQKEEIKEEVSKDFVEEKEDKSYDIMDVLKMAKEKNEDDDKRYQSLDNTNYNILKQLKIEKENNKEPKDEGEELKELINTITSTSMLNKLGDEELSLKLLEDLQGETRTVNANDPKIDNSFFTTSMKLNKEDFEEENVSDSKKIEKNKIIKIAVFVALAILTIILIVLLIKKFI